MSAITAECCPPSERSGVRDRAEYAEWARTINGGTIDAVNLLAHLTYLSPYDLRWQNTIIGIEWTLGIEVFFYVLIGALVRTGWVRPQAPSMAVFGMAALAVFVLQWIVARSLAWDPRFAHWLPFGYFPMFFLGTLAFVVRRDLKTRFPDGSVMARRLHTGADLVLLTLLVAMLALSTVRTMSGRVPEAYFVVATFIVIVTHRRGTSPGLLCSRPMLFMGSISFSFYLLHHLIIQFISHPTNSVTSNFALQLTASIAVSVLWCEVFEKQLYRRAKAAIKQAA